MTLNNIIINVIYWIKKHLINYYLRFFYYQGFMVQKYKKKDKMIKIKNIIC